MRGHYKWRLHPSSPQLQAGITAENDIQLPPRDTRVIDKNTAKDTRDIEQGQQLRDSHGQHTSPPANDNPRA